MHDGTPTQIELMLLLARKQQVKDDAFASEVNRRGSEIADEIDEQIALAQEALERLLHERQRFAVYRRPQPQQSGQPTEQRSLPKEATQPPMRLAAKQS